MSPHATPLEVRNDHTAHAPPFTNSTFLCLCLRLSVSIMFFSPRSHNNIESFMMIRVIKEKDLDEKSRLVPVNVNIVCWGIDFLVTFSLESKLSSSNLADNFTRDSGVVQSYSPLSKARQQLGFPEL